MSRTQSSDDLDISESLRALMQQHKLTVAEMAERCGVSKSAMEKYLAGTSSPRAGIIQKICIEFGVEADWILFGYSIGSSFSSVLLSSAYASFQSILNELKQKSSLSEEFEKIEWGSSHWRNFLLNVATERANEIQADVSARLYKERQGAMSGIRKAFGPSILIRYEGSHADDGNADKSGENSSETGR